MLASGLYTSLVLLLIGTFKLAGCAPGYSFTFSCSGLPEGIQQKCCDNGQWDSSRDGCHP
ncbi:hypothetical protein PGT21_031784 [Puccinia graminis f. sp. tritici]|uniref:Chitin-binding type-2 domain-containing protein n=1 Tax=Puccinia graminis f. sp. tritici TaxID=56615 RepID=A0A5B0LPZ9_PUCGR|nr:hypothetical protein PGT21_031784 [Puccinia graminis f. sp. tritici]KAA1081892.1 hypothetical protein PGTUg99_026823 [Puccinia graminis f. sp. tritici]